MTDDVAIVLIPQCQREQHLHQEPIPRYDLYLAILVTYATIQSFNCPISLSQKRRLIPNDHKAVAGSGLNCSFPPFNVNKLEHIINV